MTLFRNFWLFLLWLGIILYLSFTPLSGWPKVSMFQKLYLDKLVHISMYAFLSLFLLRGFFIYEQNKTSRTRIILLSILFCVLVGTGIELLQPLLTRYRQFEWMDMIANATGTFLGYFIFLFLSKRQWLGLKNIASL